MNPWLSPKVQFPALFFLTFCFPLILFFFFALWVEPDFFIFLIGGLIICIAYLIFLHVQWLQTQAAFQMQIQDIREQINMTQAGIVVEEQKIHSFRAKISDYFQLKGLTEKLSMCLSLEDTSKTLATEVGRLLGDGNNTIILYLFHSKTGELGISASQKGTMSVNVKSKKGDVFDQWVARNMQSLLVEDVRTDFRFDLEKAKMDDDRTVRSLMSIPLISSQKILGILRIDYPSVKRFDTEDLRFLTTIGDLAAVAIENAQLYERVGELAIKDGLTGLYLRRYLLERLPEEISRELRRKKPLSFLMIDLDHFKKYNDQFGHVAGDIVLRTVGMMLSDSFKEPGNLVCRYGGEEFSILLPECSKEKALELAEGARRKIEKQPIILRREKTFVTISVGAASFPKDAQIKEDLIHKADQALYRAKEKGRNRVEGAP